MLKGAIRPALTPMGSRLIVHHMVNHQECFAGPLDASGSVLPARQERESAAPVTDVVRRWAAKRSTVMKHVGLPGETELIARSEAGRTVTVRLTPEPMRAAMDGLQRYGRLRSRGVERLVTAREQAGARERGR